MRLLRRKPTTTAERQLARDAKFFKASFTITDSEELYKQTYSLSHEDYFELYRQLARVLAMAYTDVEEMAALLPARYWRVHFAYADFNAGGYSGTGSGGMTSLSDLPASATTYIALELRDIARQHGGSNKEGLLSLVYELRGFERYSGPANILDSLLKVIDRFEALYLQST